MILVALSLPSMACARDVKLDVYSVTLPDDWQFDGSEKDGKLFAAQYISKDFEPPWILMEGCARTDTQCLCNEKQFLEDVRHPQDSTEPRPVSEKRTERADGTVEWRFIYGPIHFKTPRAEVGWSERIIVSGPVTAVCGGVLGRSEMETKGLTDAIFGSIRWDVPGQ